MTDQHAAQGPTRAVDGPGSQAEGLGDQAVEVTVRYWAGARARAGVDSEVWPCPPGTTVQGVLTRAADAHPGLEEVLQVASVLQEGRAVDRSAPLSGPSVLEVLPPFAGG